MSFFTLGVHGSPRQWTAQAQYMEEGDVVHPVPLLVLPYSQAVRIHPDQVEEPDEDEEDSRVMRKLVKNSPPPSPPTWKDK